MGENFGKFSYLDYLGEKTLANSLFQINTKIKGSVKLREKPLVISHQSAKFTNAPTFFHYMVNNIKFVEESEVSKNWYSQIC